MTHDETRFLLARFSRCFGRKPADTATVDEWTRFLADVPATLAGEQLNRFVVEGHPGPSLPLFLERCRVELRRQSAHRHPAVPKPPEDPPVSAERAREHIAAIRARLAAPVGIPHAAPEGDDAEDLW